MNYKETAAALNQFVKEGRSKYIGVSNFSTKEFDNLQYWMDEPLVTNQVEVSPLCLDAFDEGVLSQCQKYEIKPLAWSPLAGGNLFQAEHHPQLFSCLQKIADRKNSDIGQVTLSWLRKHPSEILPIIGSLNIDRIRSLSQYNQCPLDTQEWFDIYSTSRGVDVP